MKLVYLFKDALNMTSLIRTDIVLAIEMMDMQC